MSHDHQSFKVGHSNVEPDLAQTSSPSTPVSTELDPRDYPLSDTPTPPALKRFCFDLNGQPTYFRENEDSEEAIVKLQEALYNMRASGPTSKSTILTIQAPNSLTSSDTTQTISSPSERKISGIVPRKRPASPVEISSDASLSNISQQQQLNSPSYGSKSTTTKAHKSLSPPHKKVRAKFSKVMQDEESELDSAIRTNTQSSNNLPVESPTPSSSSITLPSISSSSTSTITRHYNNTISTSNLGIDTPSTTRSTHSSALPSPSLSPITGDDSSNSTNQFDNFLYEPSIGNSDDAMIEDGTPNSLHITQNWTQEESQGGSNGTHIPSLLDLPTMLSTFDALPSSMQSYMLFHLLRRCPTNTLQYVSNIILPALRRDFLGMLPFELSLQIVRYLDAPSMCKAAQVSKRWRTVIDSDGYTWRRRLEADGFGIDEGEESLAILENWGTLLPSMKSTTSNNRDNKLNCNIAVKEESGASSSEERTVIENDEDPGDMRIEGAIEQEEIVVKIENPSQNSKKSRNSYDEMSLDIEEKEENNYTQDSSSSYSFTQTKNQAANSNNSTPYSNIRRYVTPQKSDKGKGRSERSSDRPEMSEEALPLPPSAEHPYKAIYRRHYLIRQNWIHGRSTHISFPGHGPNVVTCLQFDSDKIISGSDDQCINVYDTKTGTLRKRLEGHDGGVWALQYVDNTLVSGSTDRTVRVWDIERGVCTHVFPGHTSTVRCLQIILPKNVNINPNESPIVEPPIPLIVTGSRDSTLRVWRLPNSATDPSFTPNIPLSPSDNVTENPYFVRALQGHTHSVRALAGVGNTLISGSYDCTVRVWNIMTGECYWRLHGHTQKVYSVVLDAKRKRCMSGSMDGTVKVWSLEDGTCVWTLEGHSSLVGLLDLSHDFLVSAAADSSLRIWNPNDGTCRHVLTAHTGAITCFQHDDQKVISGSDGTLKMWDVKTGKPIRDLLTGLSGVWQVRFDERRCVAAVQRSNVTWFEVLDFGVEGIEGRDENDLGENNDNGEVSEYQRTILGLNDSFDDA
ncbi:8540_t:CDS:2 [Ambispora gerdemannii]|uniref:8540_t:CDS:1 n=1 Tax=Ambispora gerdemannii TaxID=144530 RepID=A0A9N9AW23_9GLOM|nr:8540_t:CDS:2 [Ambispora gerdemannii]